MNETIGNTALAGRNNALVMPGWQPIETLKQDDFVVLAFSEDWKDPDFNPDGIREAFRNEDDNGPIVSAKWSGCHDCWDTEYDSKPTHWMPRPTSKTEQQLYPLKLEDIFSNIERLDDDRCQAFRVRNKYGSDAGTISYLGNNEWRIFVDNFPSEKKYFSTNLPMNTVRDFINNISKTGLKLVEA